MKYGQGWCELSAHQKPKSRKRNGTVPESTRVYRHTWTNKWRAELCTLSNDPAAPQKSGVFFTELSQGEWVKNKVQAVLRVKVFWGMIFGEFHSASFHPFQQLWGFHITTSFLPFNTKMFSCEPIWLTSSRRFKKKKKTPFTAAFCFPHPRLQINCKCKWNKSQWLASESEKSSKAQTRIHFCVLQKKEKS